MEHVRYTSDGRIGRRTRALALCLAAWGLGRSVSAETVYSIRDGVLFIRADTPAKRSTDVSVGVAPSYSTNTRDDVVYWTDPAGRLLEARRVPKGTAYTSLTFEYSALNGDYRLEVAGDSYRYYTVTVDNSIAVMQEPAKGHWYQRTPNASPAWKYHFNVTGPFTVGAVADDDQPQYHPCVVDIYDNTGALAGSIDTFDADGDGSDRVAIGLAPAYCEFTSEDVAGKEGIWYLQPTANRRVGMWLDGMDNLLSSSSDPVRHFVPELLPTETIEFTVGQPDGWAPLVGGFYVYDPSLAHWVEFFKLQSLHVYEDMNYREPVNDNADPDDTDPAMFNITPAKYRLKDIMVDSSLGGHNGPGDAANAVQASVVFQPSAAWLSSNGRTLDHYDDGGGGPHLDVKEYRECIVEYVRQLADPSVPPYYNLAPDYLALQDEPNFNMPQHAQQFDESDWLIAQTEIANALRSVPGAEDMKVVGPMTSQFWDGHEFNGQPAVGIEWSETVYAADPEIADAVCFDFWQQRSAYGRELSFVLGKANELLDTYDPGEDDWIVINQMNMSWGGTSSVYDVTTGAGSLWWAAQVCHAARADRNALMHFFTVAHDYHQKGLLNAAGQPNPWGYATRFIQASKQEWSLSLTDDGYGVEVDGMVTYDPRQRILNVFFVNKVARTANVRLNLTVLPDAFCYRCLDVTAYRLDADGSVLSADAPVSTYVTSAAELEIELAPEQLYSAFITGDGPYEGIQPAWFANCELAEQQDEDSNANGFSDEEETKWGGVPGHYNPTDPIASPAPFVCDCVPPDCDCDDDVDLGDLADFEACLWGPGNEPGPGCACFDLDIDGDVDLIEFVDFQRAFTGPQP